VAAPTPEVRIETLSWLAFTQSIIAQGARVSPRGEKEWVMSVQKTVAMTDHHLIAWFSELQRREKNTFWACVGGWVLDAMDVQCSASRFRRSSRYSRSLTPMPD
jgi:hypothetical protein